MKDNKKIKFVVAQPLIGGMPIGFENAFGTAPQAIISAGFKNDSHYIKYMNETRSLAIPVINMDETYSEFKDDESEQIYNDIKNKGVDCLMHVAICSGLSMLNTQNSGKKGRGNADNDQNQNMYSLTKLGMKMDAKVVVFENAPGAYTKSGESTIEKLKEIASEYNYSTHLLKTDTLLHGIPQSRKRTFISFYKNSNPGLFNYEFVEYTKLVDYLSEIDSNIKYSDLFLDIEAKDKFYEFVLDWTGTKKFYDAMKKIFPNKATSTALFLTEQIGFDKCIDFFEHRYKETKDEKYLKGIKLSEHCKKKKLMGKGYWDSSTYLANDGLYINALISKNIHRSLHPTEERSLSVREMLHLMGMPHNFEMIDPKKNWCHISQNVPVKTATYVGNQIKAYLNNELEITNVNFIKQDNIKQRCDSKINKNGEEW